MGACIAWLPTDAWSQHNRVGPLDRFRDGGLQLLTE